MTSKSKTIILLAILGLVLGIAIFKMATTGRLYVSLLGSEEYEIQINNIEGVSVFTGEKIKNSKSLFLSSGKYEVILTRANQEKSFLINLKGFLNTKEISTQLENQLNRNRISGLASSCNLLNVSLLYSYECGYTNSVGLLKGPTLTSKSSRVNVPLKGLSEAIPYRDGLLGLRIDGQSVKLTYFSNKKIFSEINDSETLLSGQDNPTIKLLGDVGGENGFFVVIKGESVKIARYESLESSPTVYTLDIDEEEILGKQISVAGSSKRILIVLSPPSEGLEGNIAPGTTVNQFSKVIVLNKENLSEKANELVVNSVISSATVCGDMLCALEVNGLSIYNLNNPAPAKIAHIRGVGSIYTSSGGSFFIKAGGVYSLDTEQLESVLIYSSSNYEASSLFALNETLLVTTFNKNSEFFDVFTIDKKVSKNNLFLDNALPIITQDPVIQGYDFTDGVLHVTLLLNSAYVADDKIFYDKTEYKLVTQKIENFLRASGINISEIKIVYDLTY